MRQENIGKRMNKISTRRVDKSTWLKAESLLRFDIELLKNSCRTLLINRLIRNGSSMKTKRIYKNIFDPSGCTRSNEEKTTFRSFRHVEAFVKVIIVQCWVQDAPEMNKKVYRENLEMRMICVTELSTKVNRHWFSRPTDSAFRVTKWSRDMIDRSTDFPADNACLIYIKEESKKRKKSKK